MACGGNQAWVQRNRPESTVTNRGLPIVMGTALLLPAAESCLVGIAMTPLERFWTGRADDFRAARRRRAAAQGRWTDALAGDTPFSSKASTAIQ